MDLSSIVIPELNEDQNVEVLAGEEGYVSLKNLLNIIIAFINKLIKFEF